jgi:hypothetical protein
MPDDLNPYQSSGFLTPSTGREAPGPYYQVRLSWADRRDLLKSIFPTRFCIIVAAVWWMKGLAEHISLWSAALTRESYGDAIGTLWVGLAIVWVLVGVFMLSLCRLEWIYANHLQAAAGGRVATHREWTELQCHLARLSAIAWVLMVAVEVGFYAIRRWDEAAVWGRIGG